MEQTHLDWYLAGILDGEGYLGIIKATSTYKDKKKQYYVPVIKVASVDKIICEVLQNRFGGHLTKRIHAQVNHKLSWMWEVKSSKKVLPVLEATNGKLLLKSKQSKVLKEFIAFRENNKSKMNKGFSEEDWNLMEKLYLQIRDLNYRGVRPAETK